MDFKKTLRAIGHATLDLIHPSIVEQFEFVDDRYVAATVGEQEGYVTAPLLTYQITNTGSVVIGDESGEWYRWEEIQLDGEILRVRCDGIIKEFSITPGRADTE